MSDVEPKDSWLKSWAPAVRSLVGRQFTYKLYETWQQIFGYPDQMALHEEIVGRRPDLSNPQTFNEKITWLKLYDKNPTLPIVVDKVRVRDWVAARIGKEVLMDLVGVYKNAAEIKREEMPDQFIAKTNHGTAQFVIARNKADLDWDASMAQLEIWLHQTQVYKLMEWYQHSIPPRIIVEHLLLDEGERIPSDYKFYVFHGTVRLIYCASGRFENKSLNFYDREWNHNAEISRGHEIAAKPPPSRLEEMIAIAERLGGEFPFMRVDLYCEHDRIYFGELTPHPYSGLCEIISLSFDIELGTLLDLDRCRGCYWKLK